jgi:hypothetical protein
MDIEHSSGDRHLPIARYRRRRTKRVRMVDSIAAAQDLGLFPSRRLRIGERFIGLSTAPAEVADQRAFDRGGRVDMRVGIDLANVEIASVMIEVPVTVEDRRDRLSVPRIGQDRLRVRRDLPVSNTMSPFGASSTIVFPSGPCQSSGTRRNQVIRLGLW